MSTPAVDTVGRVVLLLSIIVLLLGYIGPQQRVSDSPVVADVHQLFSEPFDARTVPERAHHGDGSQGPRAHVFRPVVVTSTKRSGPGATFHTIADPKAGRERSRGVSTAIMRYVFYECFRIRSLKKAYRKHQRFFMEAMIHFFLLFSSLVMALMTPTATV